MLYLQINQFQHFIMKNKYKRSFGWKPQLPDHRDLKISFKMTNIPDVVDLRPQFPPVYDQGQLGSCTGNAWAAAYQFVDAKQKHDAFIPSRLFIYYNEREMEGTVNIDAGAIIRDGIKSIVNQGVCPETDWPYIPSKFQVRPDSICYSSALKNQVLSYHSVQQNLDQLRSCLAEGFPIVFGMSVYPTFMSDIVAKTGYVTMPGLKEAPEGGHAIVLVGYDKIKELFIVRNSWGSDWGDKGYFYLPNAYVTNPDLCSDFWTIRVVE